MQRISETIKLAQTLKEVLMKNKSISRMLKAAGPIMVVCVVLTLGASAAAQEPIQGSWIFTVTPAPGGPPPFSALASFAAGGVFLATGEADRLNPASELHGSWERITGNRYGSTAYFFVFDPTGHAVGMLQTNQVFQLTSKKALVGLGDLSACDVQGENCMLLPGVSTITGKRMIVKDLPTL
jgi:hypothetical protein